LTMMRPMKTTRFIVLLALGTLFSACGPTEASVKEEITAANHCEVDTDCASAGTKCPFGCSIPVNKSEVARIKQLLDDFGETNCQYDCINVTGFACQSKVCVAKTGP
jgi:hypothetical protein